MYNLLFALDININIFIFIMLIVMSSYMMICTQGFYTGFIGFYPGLHFGDDYVATRPL